MGTIAEKQQGLAPADIPVRAAHTFVIRPTHGWVSLKLGEMWAYRELLYFLTWRDIKVRYKQTILGMIWAVIQPFMTMVVFSLFFGGLAGVPSDGVPYPVFSFAALVPWSFFATAMTQSSNSLVGAANLIKKVYFPRLVVPISSVVSPLVDFALAFAVLIGMIVFFSVVPTMTQIVWEPGTLEIGFVPAVSAIPITANVIWLPFFLALAFMTALAVGLWLSAMNVQFRDVHYMVPFLTQFWMFATPIAYPASLITNNIARMIYSLNPMVGVVEGFRWALLGTDTQPGPMIVVSTLAALALLIGGAFYFRRMEKTFADVV